MTISISSYITSLLNLFGILQVPKYDVIVIGAGAGGCPLAQTLAEGGLKVLLVERGGERVESTMQLSTNVQAIRSVCAESIQSVTGATLTTGNCMGGATSVNTGIFVQELPEWIQNITSNGGAPLYSSEEIAAAFDWIRERLAPEPAWVPPGSAEETYFNSLVDVYKNRSDFNVVNVDPGQPFYEENGVWRVHSTFQPVTGKRRSADTLLDRNNENLVIRTNTKVSRILFDGDFGVPLTAGYKATNTPRARCVRFTSLEVVCVKGEGRIYLSSGALHTPELLLKSGIGPGGRKVKNSKVGQNLADKPLLFLSASFQPNFDDSNQYFTDRITATQPGTGTSGRLLYEESNFGIPVLLPLAAWERSFVPMSLRNSLFAATVVEVLDFCQKNIEDPPIDFLGPSVICNAFVPLVKAGCDRRFFGIGIFASEPTSRGSVTLDSSGRLRIDANYMDAASDKEAMGAAARVAFQLLTSISGPSAPQTPCVDKGNATCMAMSCPDLLAENAVSYKTTLAVVMPSQAYKIRTDPASVISPHYLEPALANSALDDEAVGELMREDIVATFHFAGTAAIGSVVDGSSFKVIGVEGLYVADASVLPTTTRGNPMATIMALGRIAGLRAVKDLA